MIELIVDPHKTDFFVTNVKAYFLGRKPLLKYARKFDGYVYSRSRGFLRHFIDTIHAEFWNFMFSKDYGFKLRVLTNSLKLESVLFHTLPSVHEDALGKVNYVYFSHAYLYIKKLEWLGQLTSVRFIAENYVGSSLLATKFELTNFSIERFKLRSEVLKCQTSGLYSTSNSVLITGTFHTQERNKIFRNNVSKYWGISTLHEVRRFITEMAAVMEIPNLVVCTTELVQTNSFNSILNGRQRDYFKMDIVQEMLKAKYVIVDIELLTDIVPINFAEAVVCGAIPVVPRKLLQIEDLISFSDGMIIYEDKNDLLNKLLVGLGDVDVYVYKTLQQYVLSNYRRV
jgi:hypothetical protein